MRPLLTALSCVIVIAFSPMLVHAQSVTLDEGTFLISVDGTEAGSESFTIRRSGTGSDAQIIAFGEILLQMPEGRLDLRPALEASGGDMAVSAYQIKVSGDRQEEIYVTLADRRFLTRVRTERGEQEREYRAASGTLLLDTGVAHQYFFLSTRLPGGSGTVPVIVPREGRQFEMRVSLVGDETIQIGGSPVQARHLRLEGAGETRNLWIDSEGRVLILEHPSAGYRAVREATP